MAIYIKYYANKSYSYGEIFRLMRISLEIIHTRVASIEMEGTQKSK